MQGSIRVNRILIILPPILIIIFLVLFTLVWLAVSEPDWMQYLVTLFTAMSALATAYAALSASKSARVAELSASTWKKQMQLEIELTEAKNLKVALHAWHRHFVHESQKYAGEDLVRICELIEMQLNGARINQVNHLQRYLDKHEELWNNLEKSFDNASFIENDFDERLHLRRLSLTYSKGCQDLLSYYQQIIQPGNNFLEINCSALYSSSDWHQLDLAGINITRVKLEKLDESGKLVPIKKENGDFVYISLQDSVQSWHTQIGNKIDCQIEAIKNKLGSI
jgi:CRISPR/Cas system CSM-associated protein Csm2 small subunit